MTSSPCSPYPDPNGASSKLGPVHLTGQPPSCHAGGMAGSPVSMATRREAVIDRILHLAAIAAAVVGSGILVRSLADAARPELEVPISLYIFGLLAMLICSALYNAADRSPWRPVLRRLDYAAIFVLVAGTYSPFLGGSTNNRILGVAYAAVWILALAGVLAQLLFHGRIRKGLSVALYLALGWSVILIIGPVSTILPAKILWLIALGGMLYTAGVLFHVARRFPYQNAIWHGFVVTAASVHYIAVLTLVRS
jgi:hemolysin III